MTDIDTRADVEELKRRSLRDTLPCYLCGWPTQETHGWCFNVQDEQGKQHMICWTCWCKEKKRRYQEKEAERARLFQAMKDKEYNKDYVLVPKQSEEQTEDSFDADDLYVDHYKEENQN